MNALALASRRHGLWALLVALVVFLLALLVWLAGRFESSQVQNTLDRQAVSAVNDVRSGLNRNVQTLQAIFAGEPGPSMWSYQASTVLREHRELLRIEWRDTGLGIRAHADTPFRGAVFDRLGREHTLGDVSLACATARRFSGPAYSTSYFLPQSAGLGIEVLELCMPLVSAGQLSGYLVATYSLQDMLGELIEGGASRGVQLAFTEADGTRLALHGAVLRSNRVFTAQHLLDLPGNTLVLRIDSWRAEPDLFPNVLTALVTALSIALLSVLAMLGKDMRRRLRAEHGLADALAFRKAMEDSLVTGLRARDLQGRITYVNPAFCAMVGLSADELLGTSAPAPYWPPELVDEYQKRQAIRLAGSSPPRQGFESVFLRKDGSRFPVLIIEAPLIDATGIQTGWMSAVVDISEQRRVEELSRTSQERLQATARLATVGEMASLLSHELNQPLAAISSYATGSLNLLPRQDGLHAELETAMRRIAEQAERAGRVIRSVHDFVRRREQDRVPVAPRALIDAVMPLVQLQARKLGVQVETVCAEGLPDVLCDATMVEQVLLNLARNAMQAMDRPEIVRRKLVLKVVLAPSNERTIHHAGWTEFSVADVGPGIAPEVAAQLFTPFFTTKAEGMGLGLSLCRTVVEQHGGFLGFDANHPQGTIFRFTLPVAPP